MVDLSRVPGPGLPAVRAGVPESRPPAGREVKRVETACEQDSAPASDSAHPAFLEHGIILSPWFPGDAVILDFMG